MSVARQCAICGEDEWIRWNFTNIEEEKKFHSDKYYCPLHLKINK